MVLQIGRLSCFNLMGFFFILSGTFTNIFKTGTHNIFVLHAKKLHGFCQKLHGTSITWEVCKGETGGYQ